MNKLKTENFFRDILFEVYNIHKDIDDVFNKKQIDNSIFLLYKKIDKSDLEKTIFGTKIICFTNSNLIIYNEVKKVVLKIKIEDIFELKFYTKKLLFGKSIFIDSCRGTTIPFRDDHFTNQFRVYKTCFKILDYIIKNYQIKYSEFILSEQKRLNQIAFKEKELEDQRKSKLTEDKKTVILEFDKDGNGELDTIEVKDDFDKLVKKHQSKIIDTDRSYIQHFVKVSNYQKQKRKNLQSIFESIIKTKDQEELSSQVKLLKEQIHSYELLLFHSLNMVISLVEDDMFTFYEIYESFDKLEIFNSNHENEVSKKLKNIEGGIYNLMNSIRQMEESIIDELGYLSYVTQDSYNQLSNNINRELQSINSSIRTNNLLTGINAYQTYKLRKGN